MEHSTQPKANSNFSAKFVTNYVVDAQEKKYFANFRSVEEKRLLENKNKTSTEILKKKTGQFAPNDGFVDNFRFLRIERHKRTSIISRMRLQRSQGRWGGVEWFINTNRRLVHTDSNLHP